MSEASPPSLSTSETTVDTSTLEHHTTQSGGMNRLAVVQPPYDLRLLDYVSKVDSNLLCPICHAPFAEPKRLECDHIFCDDCLQCTFEQTQRNTATRSCPTCRRELQERERAAPLPRILGYMLDELVVKCPNSKKGCSWMDKRVEAQDHLEFYCDFAVVPCPKDDCDKTVYVKDSKEGCLHFLVDCEDCGKSLMKKDLKEHQASECPQKMTQCQDCSDIILRRDLDQHTNNVCPSVLLPCEGFEFGCPFKAVRHELSTHRSSCPISLMTPTLRAQSTRIKEQEDSQKLLQRKVEVLEGGLTNIQSLLYPDESTYASSHSTISHRNPPNAENSHNTSEEQHTMEASTHHMLTLHESLRDELSRVNAEITELDARCHVMVANETLKFREEMAHTNAAINGLRVQLHWLTSERLMQRSRGGMMSNGTGGGTNGSSGEGSGNQSNLGGPGGSTSSTGPRLMGRKLSDSGTKL